MMCIEPLNKYQSIRFPFSSSQLSLSLGSVACLLAWLSLRSRLLLISTAQSHVVLFEFVILFYALLDCFNFVLANATVWVIVLRSFCDCCPCRFLLCSSVFARELNMFLLFLFIIIITIVILAIIIITVIVVVVVLSISLSSHFFCINTLCDEIKWGEQMEKKRPQQTFNEPIPAIDTKQHKRKHTHLPTHLPIVYFDHYL